MALTWAEMTFLTQAQRTAMQQLSDLGATIQGSLGPGEGLGQISTVPPLTMSNTKRSDEFVKDMQKMLEPTIKGVRYSLAYYRKQALDELNAANP